MPENAYDIDTVVDNIERSKRALHDRRTKSLFWRFLRSVARAGLIPEYWQAVPAHEAHPRYVLYIENNWKTWLWWLSACASLAWWGWWMLGNVLNSKTVVLHDGALIENMWTASSTRVYDLGSTDVAKWIASRRHEMRRIEPGAEYLSAPVLEAGESRNVTVKWLDAALTAHCYTEEEEERRGGGGEWPWSAPSVVTMACPCMAAVEVGVLANVVLAPGTGLLFNPRISAESKLRTLVRFEEDDETEADMPVPFSSTSRGAMACQIGCGSIWSRRFACSDRLRFSTKPRNTHTHTSCRVDIGSPVVFVVVVFVGRISVEVQPRVCGRHVHTACSRSGLRGAPALEPV
jgi:hypothetical protein